MSNDRQILGYKVYIDLDPKKGYLRRNREGCIFLYKDEKAPDSCLFLTKEEREEALSQCSGPWKTAKKVTVYKKNKLQTEAILVDHLALKTNEVIMSYKMRLQGFKQGDQVLITRLETRTEPKTKPAQVRTLGDLIKQKLGEHGQSLAPVVKQDKDTYVVEFNLKCLCGHGEECDVCRSPK